MLSFTLLLLLFLAPEEHHWIQVKTSDTTKVYSYDFSSVRTNDSTKHTMAWVKVAPKSTSLYRLHLFEIECSGSFITCDSEILCNPDGSVIEYSNQEETAGHLPPRDNPIYGAIWRPIWEMAEAICGSPLPAASLH